jgi:hypothetical protein
LLECLRAAWTWWCAQWQGRGDLEILSNSSAMYCSLRLTAPATVGSGIERQLDGFAVVLGSLAAEREVSATGLRGGACIRD